MGLKILSLVDKHFYKYNIDRTFFHTLAAIERHPEVEEVICTGRDWRNYNSNITIHENIKKLYKNTREPDLVLVFLKDFEYTGLRELSIPTCIRCNEMYSYSMEQAIRRSNIKLVICHHRNDMMAYRRKIELDGIMFENIPHCVDTTIFKNYNEKKEYDLLLVGNTLKKVYPFRHRLKNIINTSLKHTYKCKILEHPGYRPRGKFDTRKHRVLEEFSREINKAKITLTCSSLYKYALTKYMEIPLSNSLIAADTPNERKSFFKSYVLELNPNSSDQSIKNKLIYFLNNNDERQKLIDKGNLIISSKRNLNVYADKFVSIVKKFLKVSRYRIESL